MEKKIIVLLDVDDVLADFKSAFRRVTGVMLNDVPENDPGVRRELWNAVVAAEVFKDIELLPDARLLAGQLGQMMWTGAIYDVELCTSGGGAHSYEKVAAQKRAWFEKNPLGFSTMNVVKTWRDKHTCMFNKADFNYILIDDSQRNIDEFKKHGGFGVLHTSTKNTLSLLPYEIHVAKQSQ